MERLKKWRREIILLMVIGVFIATRILLFESVWLDQLLKYLPFEERYETYILYDKKFRTKTPVWSGHDDEHEYILMFQWQYNKLIEEVKKDLYAKLDELVQKEQFIINYRVDETGKVITIICDSKQKDDNSFIDVEDEKKIEDICYLLQQLMKSKEQYKIYTI